MLDNWKNPLPPMIIVVSASEEDQNYFADESLPKGSQIYRTVCATHDQANMVTSIIKTIENIDVV